jgi:hypothetical protein
MQNKDGKHGNIVNNLQDNLIINTEIGDSLHTSHASFHDGCPILSHA